MPDNIDDTNQEEFPGYPHYPAKEDIMNSKENERVEIDVEGLAQSKKLQSAAERQSYTSSVEDVVPVTDDADTEKNTVNDADITDDDLIALNDSNLNYNTAGAVSGEDLDIPGAEDDDENEAIGEEDEENNYYSLGGDAHENLEEDKGE